MIKYPKITDISLVTDTISKNLYLKYRFDTDINTDISTVFSIYRPTSITDRMQGRHFHENWKLALQLVCVLWHFRNCCDIIIIISDTQFACIDIQYKHVKQPSTITALRATTPYIILCAYLLT